MTTGSDSPALETERIPPQRWDLCNGGFLELMYKITYKVKQSTWQTENSWLGSRSTFDQGEKK